jgi:V-type H+-transporting ATPase subunit d
MYGIAPNIFPYTERIYYQVDSGFLEGTVRGYKAGILTSSHYANLTQCETLEGQP